MGKTHHDMVRLSLDIPAEQHVHLKMMAIRKGISMREYILEALALREAAEEEEEEEEEEEDIEMDKESFRKVLKRIRTERYQLAKNLSKR